MSHSLFQPTEQSLVADERTYRRLSINYTRNQAQDQTDNIDAAARDFDFEACKDQYWNPERFSLLWGTPLWEQSSSTQKVRLNQLYWVAYYCQIISAEIATIFFNQTAAAGLYALDDFRLVCDTLDLESAQERAHINAFKTIAEKVEDELFGERLFTYPMRSPYVETMLYRNAGRAERFWRKLQLRAYALLSSGNAFIGCQYFTVRGMRTLNGKLVQHQLSQYYSSHPEQARCPLPSKVSYYHFLDESFHFNSSTIIGKEVVGTLKRPTAFERQVVNQTLAGCQRDHFNFSTTINGIFWYDPALFPTIYRLLRSPVFGMTDGEARHQLLACYGQETAGAEASFQTHQTALNSYKAYLADLSYVDAGNRDLKVMGRSSYERHLEVNRRAIRAFAKNWRDEPRAKAVERLAAAEAFA